MFPVETLPTGANPAGSKGPTSHKPQRSTYRQRLLSTSRCQCLTACRPLPGSHTLPLCGLVSFRMISHHKERACEYRQGTGSGPSKSACRKPGHSFFCMYIYVCMYAFIWLHQGLVTACRLFHLPRITEDL